MKENNPKNLTVEGTIFDEGFIDLRSDTVSQPTPEMRAAMACAAVGDDVYGEDPTVNALQEMAAAILGKEAGLFVPSGTMGNLAAILAHCRRGEEAILGSLAHTFLYEAGGISALGGIPMHTVPNQPDGTIRLEELEEAIRPDDAHFAPSRLILLENTHNRCGGAAVSAAYTRAVSELADRRGLAVHLDGARLFNAAAALGVIRCRTGCAGRFSHLLPEQRAVCAGRVSYLRIGKIYCRYTSDTQTIRRGDAAGWCAGRGRDCRAGEDG